MIDVLWHDLRYGWRMLGKTPGFTAAAVVTLALGIGANAAIFSAVYAVLLKPLPFEHADRLVAIWKKNPSRGWTRNPISQAEFLAWRDRTHAFERMAAFSGASCVLTGGAEAEEDPCEVAESALFPLLKVAPILGRTFSADEDVASGPRAALLSFGLWQRRFGADESVVGRTIHVNGAAYTVVGVMPQGFSHLYATPYAAAPQLWLSGIALSPVRTWNDYQAVGLLRPGVDPQDAETEMEPVSVGIDQQFPDLKGWRADVVTLRTMMSRDTRLALLVLVGAVVFVLLIACANVANLLLARAASRATEFAVRTSLGASPRRVVGQLLIESLLVSLAGGLAGVVVGWWGLAGLTAIAPDYLVNSVPGLAAQTLDARVVVLALGLSLLTTVVFGLAPALQSASPRLLDALKESSRSSSQGARSRRFRSVLVIAEIALAIVLLVGAGLMIRTLAALGRVDLGFNPAGVLTMRVPLSGERYKDPRATAEFWRRLVGAVEALPGVSVASVSRGVPIGDFAGQYFTTADRPNPPAGQVPDANYIVAGPNYFKALQMPVRKGRGFDERDATNSSPVAIVNETLANRYWPGRDPIGKQLRMGSPGSNAPWLSVVGVVAGALSQGPDAGLHPEVYVPYQQLPWVLRPEHLIVRTVPTVSPDSIVRAIVHEVHAIDRDQPATDIQTLDTLASAPMMQQRMVTALLNVFAALAMALSAIGIYSVLSYSVAQRTRELGVRLALGAGTRDILRLIVGGGALLAAIGIAIGVAAALGLTRLMSDLLFGVQATDPPTFIAVAVVVALASLAACYVPARRATRVDPMDVLRHQ